jgi:hypothetical protein
MASNKEYMKQWRAENREKSREYSKKWRAENPEYSKESSKKWREENPEKVQEAGKRWREENPEKRRESSKKWRVKNPEYSKESSKKWRAENPEKAKAHSKKWRIENPEYVKEYTKEWRAKNPERVSEQNKKNLKIFREKNRNNPNWRLHQNMRSAMSAALGGRYKSASTMEIIGCTVEGLFEHLESCASWESWMTRENYGRGGWDADHIIPIAKWSKDCPLQFALCWDKSNLQPLEHLANIRKGSR